jgi:hypothetical protein
MGREKIFANHTAGKGVNLQKYYEYIQPSSKKIYENTTLEWVTPLIGIVPMKPHKCSTDYT